MIKRVLSVALLATLGAVALAVPSQAAAAATTFVTMVGNGDYIAGNNAWVWRAGDATVDVSGSVDGQVTVSVDGGQLAGGSYFDLTFAAAPGDTLVAGQYDDAERTPFRSTGHPGIDVSGSGRGCNTVAGHFTVIDVAPDLSRLWIVYESHCEGGTAAAFGEIRYNEPGGDSDLLVAPDQIAWPDQDAGTAHQVPVTLVNTGASPVTVSSAQVTSGRSCFRSCEQRLLDDRGRRLVQGAGLVRPECTR